MEIADKDSEPIGSTYQVVSFIVFPFKKGSAIMIVKEILIVNLIMITIEDLKKLEIRIGTILSAERVENTDKLIKLEVDLGDEKRQIVTGIAEFFETKDLEGKQIPIAVNLEPKTFKGIESQGMILAASVDGRPVLLNPEEEVPAGSIVI